MLDAIFGLLCALLCAFLASVDLPGSRQIDFQCFDDASESQFAD